MPHLMIVASDGIEDLSVDPVTSPRVTAFPQWLPQGHSEGTSFFFRQGVTQCGGHMNGVVADSCLHYRPGHTEATVDEVVGKLSHPSLGMAVTTVRGMPWLLGGSQYANCTYLLAL